MTRRFFTAAVAALVLASCSGSTPDQTTPTLTVTTTSAPATVPTTPTASTTPVAPAPDDPAPTTTVATQPTAVGASLSYTPDRDGFSFENFGGGEAPAELTVNMARRLYGDAQVCSSVVDNECTPYPVILQLIQQANRSMRGGLCEGLTVLSLRLANDPITLASFQTVDDVAALVKADPALLSEIAYWYVTQFATEVQEQASAFLELSPMALARILYEDFAAAEAGEPSVGYTVGIYSEHGGHAVTPYKVTTDGDRWRVYIYDSNWPTSERWIDVDEDGWVYALAATNPTEESAAWGGGPGTMELTPMTSRAGPFTCGFCPTEDEEAGTMLTVAASGDKQMSIQIETKDGDRLGYYDGEFVNEIEGATYRYLISGPSTADPVLVFLPPGIDDFSADVDVIDVPAPAEVETSRSAVAPSDSQAPLEPEPEEDTTQAFSLLILDDERAVQIEAEVPTEPEPEPEPVAPGDPEPEPEPERQTTSLIQFSDEAVEIADIEEATVAIAVDSLEVEIDIEEGQQVAVQFAPEPPPVDDPAAPVEEQPVPATLAIEIADNTGEVLAEVEVDLTPYQVVEPVPEPEPVEPGQPEPTTPPEPAPVAPVIVAITFDGDTGTVEQEEEAVEAWVASDAEYFQAVAEDRVEEVLGESYVAEIEERNEWEPPPEFDDGPDLAETLIVDDDYWEDEQWDEVSYDDDYFEEQADAVAETFAVVEEEEWWDDDPEVWVDEFVDDHADDSTVVVIEWEPEPEVVEEPPTPTTLPPPTTAPPPPTTLPPPPTTQPPPPTTTVAPPTTTVAPPTTLPPTTLPPPTTTAPPPTTTVPPPTTTVPPPTTTLPPPTTTTPPPTTTTPPPTTTVPPPTTTAAPPTTTAPPPTTTAPPDPREGWGEPPPGYANWDDYEQETAAGITGGDDLPTFVVVADYLPPPPPPQEVYIPIVTYEYTNQSVTETISSETVTAQTGTATTTNVTTSESGILTHNSNDGHWHLDTTTVTTTETTVTNTLVDTTTVVARTGSDMTTCTLLDGVSNGCDTVRGWSPETTTVTASDAYTEASTTTATASVTVMTEEGCAEGGWRGMGDWCMVSSGGRGDADLIQFSLDEATNVRIDAESNLTYAQFVAGNNEYGDPFIYLNQDNDPDEGDHSGDADAVTIGIQVESDDDGGRNCDDNGVGIQGCINPPSTATDPDETPTITYCSSGAACTDGVPVIDNVSDTWDSEIVRTNLPEGDYVVRAAVYSEGHDGWYRLTIEEDD